MKQRGYYTLESGQKLHFSANCWYNLLEDTGMQADEFGTKLQAEFDKEDPNTLDSLNLITDIAFAAAKAYDQEEGNEITYNRFKIRAWMTETMKDEASGAEFMQAMMGAQDIPEQKGKKKRA